MTSGNVPAISRYPVPRLEDLPGDIRERMLEVQEKAGFVPNVFLTLAHRKVLPRSVSITGCQVWASRLRTFERESLKCWRRPGLSSLRQRSQ